MNEIYKTIIYILVIAALPVVVAKLTIMIDSQQKTNKYLKDNITINRVIDFVQVVVNSIAQTYVNDTKAKGEWTAQASQEAFNKALQETKANTSEEAKKVIIATYGDLDTYLTHQIEQAVNKFK